MYAQAKEETLRKLGLDPSFFSDDDFDLQPEEVPQRPPVRNSKALNRMGEDTMYNLGVD